MRLFFLKITVACLAALLVPAVGHAAKPVQKKIVTSKERLVLMPLRVPDENRNLQGSMEAALVEGLQQKYELFSGERVVQKAREIFNRESRNSSKTECDETRCMQGIAEAFQAELIATANIARQDGGYFLSLGIQNIFDNKVVYSKSLPCRNCDVFQVVEMLKELGGKSAAEGVLAAPSVQSIDKTVEREKKGLPGCAECPEMIVIPAGKFEMGSNQGDANEAPVRVVTISKNFALGKTEVTQGAWFAVMGTRPSMFNGCGDNCPVENVSWDEVQTFISRLNAKTGMKYRLPTEAEWEYACRAGGKQEYCGSDELNSVAWSKNNSRNSTHTVATLRPNAFGLYDMSGNVWEWVEDNYYVAQQGGSVFGKLWSSESESTFAGKLWGSDGSPAVQMPVDGSALKLESGKNVLRGGSWKYVPQYLRAASRVGENPELRSDEAGFRLATDLP